MRIKNKLLALSVLIISVYTASLWIVVTVMINTRFLDMEIALARSDINRVDKALVSEMNNLVMISRDYAHWDDTWYYLMNRDDAEIASSYISANIDAQTFKNLEIRLFALFSNDGSLVNAFAWDGKDSLSVRSSVPVSLGTANVSFAPIDGNLCMCAVNEVRLTNGTGDPAGWLLMARKFDAGMIERLYERTGVFVEFAEPVGVSRLVDLKSNGRFTSGILYEPGKETLSGILTYGEAEGPNGFVLRTQTFRSLRGQGMDFLFSIALLFICVAGVLFLAVGFTYRRWISMPLTALEKAVDAYKYDSPETEPALDGLHERDDEIGHVALVIRDMNERMHAAHEEVRRMNARLESLVKERTADLEAINTELEIFKKIIESTSEAIVITSLDGNIIEMNEAMSAMTGYSRDELLGRNSRVFKSGRHDRGFYESMWKSIIRDGHWEGEIWDRRKDGAVYPKWQTINIIRDENGSAINYIGVSTDISVIKEAEERLNHLAYYDPLTSLPNRMLFSDRLNHQLLYSKRNKKTFAVLFIDLDRFKYVNDSLGHVIGDSLLVRVADRLKECVRTSDTLCRIGGDEFTLILQDLVREENAGMVASQIVHRMSERFEINGSDIYIGASVGIALYPKDGSDADILLRKADAAMYFAKESGRGVYRYACGELDKANRGRLEIEARLHRALERNEFVLYYQSQTRTAESKAMRSDGLCGVEALIRWKNSDGSLVSPADFLPVAEESGFIAPLGDWVLLQACKDAKRWHDCGKSVQVSVNVAARQFESGHFASHVASILETTGLPPELLKLEITESGFMRNILQTRDVMTEIKNAGVSFAIDDFGTGYSSLNYLNQLPVDCLKIDQSFIRDMDKNRSGGDIVSALVSMAHAFGLYVVAEGVETQEQLDGLKDRGCDVVQGYFVSRPLPVGDFEQFMGMS